MERVEVLQAMGSMPAPLYLFELLGPLTGKQIGLVGGGGFQGPSCTWLFSWSGAPPGAGLLAGLTQNPRTLLFLSVMDRQ